MEITNDGINEVFAMAKLDSNSLIAFEYVNTNFDFDRTPLKTFTSIINSAQKK